MSISVPGICPVMRSIDDSPAEIAAAANRKIYGNFFREEACMKVLDSVKNDKGETGKTVVMQPVQANVNNIKECIINHLMSFQGGVTLNVPEHPMSIRRWLIPCVISWCKNGFPPSNFEFGSRRDCGGTNTNSSSIIKKLRDIDTDSSGTKLGR